MIVLSTSSPLVSIIILNYNGKDFLEACLESVFQTDYPKFEVILVDNASTDNSLELIKHLFRKETRLKVVENSENLGFAEGNNVGLCYANGKYIVLLNIDTVTESSWLKELVSTMERDSTIGAAQSKLLKLDDKEIIDSAGDIVDYYGTSAMIGGSWRERDTGQYDSLREIFSARGAAIILRKKIVDKIGLFDPDFFLSYEDVDLGWRIRLHGYKIVFVPNSVVYHAVGPVSFAKIFHNEKNRIASCIKNQSSCYLVKYNPVIPTIASIFFNLLIKRRSFSAYTMLRAIIWVLRNLRRIWRKRLFVQKYVRRVEYSEITKHMIRSNFKKIILLFLDRMKRGREKAIEYYFKAS